MLRLDQATLKSTLGAAAILARRHHAFSVHRGPGAGQSAGGALKCWPPRTAGKSAMGRIVSNRHLHKHRYFSFWRSMHYVIGEHRVQVGKVARSLRLSRSGAGAWKIKLAGELQARVLMPSWKAAAGLIHDE